MEFVGNDDALRKHLQPFYDAWYDECVEENCNFHAQLQSEESQKLLREHDFYHGVHVPLPPFTVDEIQLPGNVGECQVEGETFAVGHALLRTGVEVLRLDTLEAEEKFSVHPNREDSDTPVFSSLYHQTNPFSYTTIGTQNVVVFGSSYYLAPCVNERQYFWVNGEAYAPSGVNAFTHLASGKEEKVEGILREGEPPLYIFTYHNSLYQIYRDGTIRRVRFEVREPVNKPLSKEEAVFFFEEKIRVRCQERLNKLESRFRSLGDYHVRFGIQIPKPVVPLVLELDIRCNVQYVQLKEYKKGILRMQCEEEIMEWNLVTDEVTTTPERWDEVFTFRYPFVGDINEYATENNSEISLKRRPEGMKGKRYLNCIYTVTGYKSENCDEADEKKAAFVMKNDACLSFGAFVFHDEWYGLSTKGITHLASGVLVFPGDMFSTLGVFCIGNYLHIFSADTYTKYRLRRG